MEEENKMLSDSGEGEDRLVQQMREARSAPTVYKAMLASLRATEACCAVFVCEGVDDKKVYFHWIRQIVSSLDYEFLVCNGKDKVLKFRDLLKRDLSGIGQNVYFIVDKDFDGLRGDAGGDDIYVTETYSFENHLVTREVLEKILIIEMHCHGDPKFRAMAIETFVDVYEMFLTITRPHNKRIYFARRLGIPAESLPAKIGSFVQMGLLKVEEKTCDMRELIRLAREPDEAEVEALEGDFDRLQPSLDFRGKFASQFFLKWLALVAKDRNSANSCLFDKAPKVEARASEQISLDSLASKSSPPVTFENFIKKIAMSRLNASDGFSVRQA